MVSGPWVLLGAGTALASVYAPAEQLLVSELNDPECLGVNVMPKDYLFALRQLEVEKLEVSLSHWISLSPACRFLSNHSEP